MNYSNLENKYYLREDFNPEPISTMIENNATKRFIMEMEQVGNLFDSREEAEKASLEVKRVLKEYNCKHL